MSILLIHGVGGREATWARVLAYLNPSLRSEVVTIDASVTSGASIADMARRLLLAHPGGHVLVGHSFGGMLAQEAALIDPTRVLGLVLISTIPGADQRVAAINRGLADDIETRGLDDIAPMFGRSLVAPGRWDDDPQLAVEFVTHMLDAGAASVCAALRAIADWDARDRLDAVRCPAAVVAGSTEVDLDRQAQLAGLVHGTFEVLDDVGHLAPLEAPEQVARVISELVANIVR